MRQRRRAPSTTKRSPCCPDVTDPPRAPSREGAQQQPSPPHSGRGHNTAYTHRHFPLPSLVRDCCDGPLALARASNPHMPQCVSINARDIYFIFLIADAQFLVLQRPLSSLFTCCYLLASAFHRLCWLSHIKLRSSRSAADLRNLRWYGTERLAGVGYLLSAHILTRGKAQGRWPLHQKWKDLLSFLFTGAQIASIGFRPLRRRVELELAN
jgi:hypothetical protein